MFGVDDLFAILAGGGYALAKGAQSGSDKTRLGMYHGLKDEYLALNTDPALEAHLKKQIEDPACYNAVWERIEAYRRVRGWEPVERLPFFDKKGNLHPRNQYDETTLHGNRNRTLGMLMQTYGKLTVFEAENKIMDFGNSMYGIALLKDIVDRQKSGQRAETLEELDPYYERAEVAEAERVSIDEVIEIGKENLSLFYRDSILKNAYVNLIYNLPKANESDIDNFRALQAEAQKKTEEQSAQCADRVEEANQEDAVKKESDHKRRKHHFVDCAAKWLAESNGYEKFLLVLLLLSVILWGLCKEWSHAFSSLFFCSSLLIVIRNIKNNSKHQEYYNSHKHPPMSNIVMDSTTGLVEVIPVREFIEQSRQNIKSIEEVLFITLKQLLDIGEYRSASELIYDFQRLVEAFSLFQRLYTIRATEWEDKLRDECKNNIINISKKLEYVIQKMNPDWEIRRVETGFETEKTFDTLEELMAAKKEIEAKYIPTHQALLSHNEVRLAESLMNKYVELNAKFDMLQRSQSSDSDKLVHSIQTLQDEIKEIINDVNVSQVRLNIGFGADFFFIAVGVVAFVLSFIVALNVDSQYSRDWLLIGFGISALAIWFGSSNIV